MKMATLTKIEFAVQMTCQGCVNAIRQALDGVDGIESYSVNLSEEQVVVETSLPSGQIQKLLESTGRNTVLRGHGAGGGGKPNHLGAAVAIIEGQGVQGLARLVQVSEDLCVIDGTLEGLSPGAHGLNVHELGDISRRCASTGDHFNPTDTQHGGPDDEHRHVGDLGNIMADSAGRAVFRVEDNRVKVWDVIGRSMVVHSGEDDLGHKDNALSKVTGNSGPGIACGIIARSAGLFQNVKKYCACDGKTLWEDSRLTAGASPSSQL